MSWSSVLSGAGAGAGLIGGIISPFTSYYSAKKMNRRARKFAQWQMRNAHQMMVADLKDAGLNPILAVGKTPGMPAKPLGRPAMGQFGPFGDVAASAKAGARVGEEVKQLRMQNRNLAQQNRNLKEEESNLRTRRMEMRSHSDMMSSNRELMDIRRKLEETFLHSARARADYDQSEAGQMMHKLHRFFESVPLPLLTPPMRKASGARKR